MAYATKYQLDFYTKQGDPCSVKLKFDNYAGSITYLDGAARPFILREFNTDEDLYKPLRPQQAEINFVSTSTLSIDDFVANSDIYCQVIFEFMSSTYWSGYLLQDDFQESWEDTKHVITLRASENIGLLRSIPLQNSSGGEYTGQHTILDFYDTILADLNSPSASKYKNLYIINNLYHDTMVTTETPLSQTYIDAKTFSIGENEYLDEYTVLERINRAWSQTLFQYNNQYYIVRNEELYIPPSSTLRVAQWKFLQIPDWQYQNRRYDISVGVNGYVKPIAPSMLRFIKRPSKVDQINVDYNYPSEVLCNQNFKRGNLVTSASGYKTYTITDWTGYKGTRETPTATSAAPFRKDIIDTFGNVTDSYVTTPLENVSLGINSYSWLQSCDIQVQRGDVIDLSFLWRWAEPPTAISTTIPTFTVAQILFKADASPQFRAAVDTTGKWIIAPSTWDSWTTDMPYIKFTPNNIAANENFYYQISVLTNSVPADGIIRILLNNTATYGYASNFSQLQVRLQASLNGLNTSTIAGDFDRFTKSDDIRSNFYDTIYLADMPNRKFMGTMFDSNGDKYTPEWYRYRNNSETHNFKKQNLIAQWEQRRYFRNKIDANFFGLTYIIDYPLPNYVYPIGLINTIIFTDDDPNKVYAIVNLKEIDFANATWSCTLQEVWDEDRDLGNEYTYPTYLKDYLYK